MYELWLSETKRLYLYDTFAISWMIGRRGGRGGRIINRNKYSVCMRGEVLSTIYTCCKKTIAVMLLISLKRCKKITDRPGNSNCKNWNQFHSKRKKNGGDIAKNVCVSYFQSERIYLCMKINIISCSMLLSVIPNAHVSHLHGWFSPETQLDSLVSVSSPLEQHSPCPGPHRVLSCKPKGLLAQLQPQLSAIKDHFASLPRSRTPSHYVWWCWLASYRIASSSMKSFIKIHQTRMKYK